MSDPVKVIVTSGGSLVGQCVLDSLEGRRHSVRLIATDSVGKSAQLFRFDEVHLVPPTPDPCFKDSMRGIIERVRPHVITPGTDTDVTALAELRSESDQPQSFTVGSIEAAAVIADKLASWEFSRDRCLPFAPTIRTDNPDAAREARRMVSEFGLPLVAKPRFGSASQGIYFLLSEDHVSSWLGCTDYVVQPFLGPPLTRAQRALADVPGLPLWLDITQDDQFGCQAVIRPDGDIEDLATVLLHHSAGRLWGMEALNERAVCELGSSFARAMAELGWRGLINVQGTIDPALGPIAWEFNGRFNGGTSARRLLGFDEVRTVVNLHSGMERIPAECLMAANRVERSFGDFGGRGEETEQLARTGVWTA